jgi:hypothetical protein
MLKMGRHKNIIPQETKDKILYLYFEKQLTIREVSKEIGKDTTFVHTILHESGKVLRPPSKRKKFTPFCESKLVDVYKKKGVSAATKVSGFSEPYIYELVRQHGGFTHFELKHQREKFLLHDIKNCWDLGELWFRGDLKREHINDCIRENNLKVHSYSRSGPKRVEMVLRMLAENHHPWVIEACTGLSNVHIHQIRRKFGVAKSKKQFFRVFIREDFYKRCMIRRGPK